MAVIDLSYGSGEDAPEEPGAPIFGVGNLIRMVKGIPSGLFHLGEAVVKSPFGDEESQDFLKMFGKGFLRSLQNTAVDIADLPLSLFTSPFIEHGGLLKRALDAIEPDDWEPESMRERGGILPSLVEDVGNVALAFGGAAGVAGKAAGAAEVAGQGVRAGTIASQAARIARLGEEGALGGRLAEEAGVLGAEGAGAAGAGVEGAFSPAQALDVTGYFPSTETGFQGFGKAAELEQQAARLRRGAHPYREFAFPAVRKALTGGTFQLPEFFGTVEGQPLGVAPIAEEAQAAQQAGIPTPAIGPKDLKVRPYGDVTEMVDVGFLKRVREFDRKAKPLRSAEQMDELRKSITEEGIKEPVILDYDPSTQKFSLAEGNHRLTVAEELGEEAVPTRVMVKRRPFSEGEGVHVPEAKPAEELADQNGYIKGDLPPSAVLPEGTVKVPSQAPVEAGPFAPKHPPPTSEADWANQLEEAWYTTLAHERHGPETAAARDAATEEAIAGIRNPGKWEAFSKARGYTPREMAEYTHFVDLVQMGKRWGHDVDTVMRDVLGSRASKDAAEFSAKVQEYAPNSIVQKGVVNAAQRVPRTVTFPKSQALTHLVQGFDMQKLVKTLTRKMQAGAREGVFRVQAAMEPGLKRFGEMTPGWTDEIRSKVLYELIHYHATQGELLGAEGLKAQLEPTTYVEKGKRAVREPASSEFRELRALDPERRAQALAAWEDPEVRTALQGAAEQTRAWETIRRTRLGKTVFGKEGLRPEDIDFSDVRDSRGQAARRKRALRLQAKTFEWEDRSVPEAVAGFRKSRDAIIANRAKVQRSFNHLMDQIGYKEGTPYVRPEQIAERVAPPKGPASKWGDSALVREAKKADRAEQLSSMLDHYDRDIATLNDMIANPQTSAIAEYAATVRAEAQGVLDAITYEQKMSPRVSQVAPRWQPLVQGFKDVRDIRLQIGKMRGLKPAEVLEQMEADGLTWQSITQKAAAEGFNPAHIREFQPGQVKRLVHDGMTLRPRLLEAGTRTERVGVASATADHSLEALAAAFTEVELEARSSELFQQILKNGWAQPIPEGMVEPPPGWSRFRPTRKGLANVISGEMLDLAPTARDLMMPEGLSRYLGMLTNNFDNIVNKTVGKITSPWRTFVLTASPRWYFNNAVSNVIMATSQGVKLSDWVEAYHKAGIKPSDILTEKYVTRFPGVPAELKTLHLAQEVGSETVTGGIIPSFQKSGLVPGPNIGKGVFGDLRAGGSSRWEATKGASKVLAEHAQRYNQVIDEWARTAVFEAKYRESVRLGMSPERAAERATEMAVKGLVDYSNLTPFERQMVRTFIPFYAWQKGIMEMAVKLAIDHPARVQATFLLGQVNNELEREEAAQLPTLYRGLIPLPGNHYLRSQGWNPFSDALGLLDPDSVRQSINPFVQILTNKVFRQGSVFGPKEIDQWGRAVPSYSMFGGLVDIAKGLPQGHIFAPSAGKGVLEGVTNFLGPSTVSEEGVQTQKDRYAQAQEQVAKGAPLPISHEPQNKSIFYRAPVTFGNNLMKQRTFLGGY